MSAPNANFLRSFGITVLLALLRARRHTLSAL